ncbi:unnamed protein product [Schistosoma margrebowiei]|uniref:Uncharacterized protein n=1 Tax=Schistosoma margrebowiei TaxID=48269 RepID=A0A183M732_9TREM|nr:unnamed protein product [Schistosoma margrebowiei]
MRLDDLDLADDLAFSSHTHQRMQAKTVSVAEASASVGLSIYKGKARSSNTTQNTDPVTLDGEAPELVYNFTYLESTIDEQGGSDADMKATTYCGRE